MEIQTKERLTGAIVLVVLVVVLVPELLSGRKSESVAPVATSASEGAEAAPLRSYTIDLESSAAQPAAASGAQSADQASAAPSQPSPPLSLPEAPLTNAPVPTPAPQAAPAVAPKPATASTKPELPATPVRAKAGEFVVQVGTFSSRENADRLTSQLTGKGFSAYVAPVKGGKREMYRVRVGPSGSRDAATALAARLKSAGHEGKVVPAG